MIVSTKVSEIQIHFRANGQSIMQEIVINFLARQNMTLEAVGGEIFLMSVTSQLSGALHRLLTQTKHIAKNKCIEEYSTENNAIGK